MNAEERTSQEKPVEIATTHSENANKSEERPRLVVEEEENARCELPDAAETSEELKGRSGRLKRVIDSESEDESKLSSGGREDSSVPVARTRRKAAPIDSDSESDDEGTLRNTKPETARKPKLSGVFDGDSEEETESGKPQEAGVYAVGKEGKLISENNNNNSDHDHYSRVSALCDPETSDDEEEQANVKRNEKSETKQPIRGAPKKMTGRDALEQRREIRSESCRRARERQLSLPYHKPKDRTLKEFLQNRPRFADALLPKHAPQTPPSLAIKMCDEELEAMSKNLKERERKAEEFFKSESSESEGEREESTRCDAKGGLDAVDGADENDVGEKQTVVLNADKTGNCDASPEREQCEAVATCEVNSKENDIRSARPEEKVNSKEDCSINPVQFTVDNENSGGESLQSVVNNQAELEQEKLNQLIAKYSDVKCNEDAECNNSAKKSKLELLRNSLGLSRPKLSGTPNQIIDLEEGVAKPNEVTQLMERFMQHAAKKNHHHKTKVRVDVISTVDGEVRKEILSVPVDPDETESIIEKPGVRLRKLRDELQVRMARRRFELRKGRKARNNDENKNETGGEVENVEYDAVLDDEEEGEFTEGEDSEGEEEAEEEEDSEGEEPEAPRKKLAFADEEAEESDDAQQTDDELLQKEVEDDGEEEEEDTNEVENSEITAADGDDESEDPRKEVKKKRKLKRIVQAFPDDSDDENVPPPERIKSPVLKKPEQKVDDSTDTWDDSGPPPHQPGNTRTPRGRDFSQTKSQLGFLTPVIHLTGLQNFLDSESKFLRDSPATPHFDLDAPPPPSPPTSWTGQVLQKKLFDPSEIPNVAEEEEEMIAPSTQDLLEICSGSFSPPGKEDGAFAPSTPGLPEENTSGPLFESNSNDVERLELAEVGDDDDRIISQLLDEEELEEFKKRFESPVVRAPSSSAAAAAPPTKIGRFVFESSGDEEADGATGRTEKKVNKKKLVFSDDDEEEDERREPRDEDGEADDRDGIVEYDSEENEVEADKGENSKKTYKMSDFVENEAELSESEWGSEDEDEDVLDDLEFEQGDAETFDENKVRDDLGRIHMRRILDDDNREVKILQELLLEDGELHGTGRQRQFKWKNIDSVSGDFGRGVEEEEPGVHLDEYGDGENEEHWRKLRYQRELFLKTQDKAEENDEAFLSHQSQVFKLGQAAIRRSVSQSAARNENPPETQHRLLPLQSKRGSFLSRGDAVLTRLAGYSMVTAGTTTGATAKNSRKFVFRSVTSTTEEITAGKKRRQTGETPNAIKKLRLSNLSPATAAPAPNEKNNRAKKLFGNW